MSSEPLTRPALLGRLAALLSLALLAAWLHSTLDLLAALCGYALLARWAPRVAGWFALLFGGLTVLLLVTAVADAGFEYFFARPLELKYDLFLVPALWDLMEDGVGTPFAIVVTGLALMLLVALGSGFAWLLRRAVEAFPGRQAVAATALAFIAFLVLAPPLFATVDFAHGLGDAYRVSSGEDKFELAIAEAREQMLSLPDDLGGLGGQDFIMLFIESYGRLLWDDPAMREDFQKLLLAMGQTAGEAGVHVSSHFLGSTTVGGASWLAHMSIMSGVRCRNTPQWKRLLASQVRPLPDYFRARGYETVSVMPAMNIDEWPEGEYFGFTRDLWARELDYQGERLAWSPMPDQFTLLRFHELVLAQASRPVFAEVSLTSSHAPFMLIPPYHEGPWKLAALNRTLREVPPTRTDSEWTDYDPDAYVKAVSYSFRSAADFVLKQYRRRGTVVILGDHQPTKAVHRVDSKGMGHIRDVPMHVLTRDPVLHAKLLEVGFVEGFNPSGEIAVLPMEELKGLLLNLLHVEEAPGA